MPPDPRFHPAPVPRSLAEIAAATGAALPEGADGSGRITGAAPLQAALPGEISYLDNRRFLDALRATRASAVLLRAEHAGHAPPGTLALIVADPHLAFARASSLLHPLPAPRPGIHPTAVVAPDARIGEGCEIGPYAVIGAGAEIGARSIVEAHAVIGPGCVFGEECRIMAHATVSHTLAGRGVRLHPGARVGQEGFGFAAAPDGSFVSVPQLGRVILGDFVEIGANACVDRGSGRDTVLGAGTRLDNLVQVGHNVETGRGCVIVAQAGLAGSARLGDFVTLAGQAGVAGHVTVGSGARVGAQSGVMADVPPKTDVVGSPAWPARLTLKAFARLKAIAEAPTAPAGQAGE
ncbi:MAG: UDP-3-O-(3-hydroxymyristoyl)glucosamine N-acyltransferase [Acetobacteraceae bacterium]|nr:UDP-3-O-(3-hydroxymyristoyl)glucosamine N-acyltransferase [Acetobacteraceae bacterium]MCX7683706.1 UDP-3-O-(3-hydroxymyristoyl)glucosamine N-acyltransferase [Acetobacteraceae bacterium]MDW8398832.1 UDP-3-O-(3-hydroxymyristoyl)glucosamine N-acyltransferase [Acetobacteraceae bacterium]